MSKYIDGKIRLCPQCHLNINECQCQDKKTDNKVRFVSLTQAQYNQLMKKEQENNNQNKEE